MDYSQLSDFEINKLVAYALGNADVGRPFDEISGTACRFTVFKNSGLNREGEIVMRPMTVTKDFCNNPEDAWPIIADNHIGIAPYPSEAFAWSSRHGMVSDLSTEDKNPLRAAMVVFLMMKDEHYA